MSLLTTLPQGAQGQARILTKCSKSLPRSLSDNTTTVVISQNGNAPRRRVGRRCGTGTRTPLPDWVKASRCHPRAARVQANPRGICDDVAPVPNARNWRLPIGLCAAALAIVGGTVQAPTAAAGSMTSTSADTRHLEVLASKSGFGLVRARVYKSTKPRTVFYVRGYGRNLRVLTEIRCDVISRGDGGLSVTAPWHPLAAGKSQPLDALHRLLPNNGPTCKVTAYAKGGGTVRLQILSREL